MKGIEGACSGIVARNAATGWVRLHGRTFTQPCERTEAAMDAAETEAASVDSGIARRKAELAAGADWDPSSNLDRAIRAESPG